MKKTMKLALLGYLVLLVCVFVFTACDSDNESQVHIHSYGEWTITKIATCTMDGIKERDCSCGDIQSVPVPATGHSFGTWQITKEVTCTVDGSEARSCACGEKETRAIVATGHSFGTWQITKEVTCTVDGSEARSCACGEKETRTISASHSWTEADCINAKTCKICNKAEGEALGHNFVNGKCNICNTIKIGTITTTQELPLIMDSKVFFETKGSIDAVTYSFSDSKLILKIDYHKIYDKKGNTAMTGFWFYVTIYDDTNTPVASELLAVNHNGVVNQKMTVTYRVEVDISKDYTIIFSEYK